MRWRTHTTAQLAGAHDKPAGERLRTRGSALHNRYMREVNVGIVGLGYVGTGTLAILAENASQIALKLGFPLRVTAVCSRTVHAQEILAARVRFTLSIRLQRDEPGRERFARESLRPAG